MKNRKNGAGDWLRRIRPELLITFCSTLIFGLLAHGMGLFNKFSHHDDILLLFGTGTTFTSGRWMLHVLGWLEECLFGPSHYSMPLYNGVFSILCCGVFACMMVDLMQIRNRICCAGLGALSVVFPVITAFFGFMYTMPYYMVALLMTAGAGCLVCKKRAWWAKIIAMILGGCAVGIYQAFIPTLLTLFLIYDLKVLSETEESVKDFILRALGQILCALGIMAFYYAANRLFLNKFGLELSDYKGINQVSNVSLGGYLARVGVAYREFFHPARNVIYDMYPMHLHYVYLGMLGVNLILCIRMAVRTAGEEKGRAVLLGAVLLLFPLGCNFIFVMCGDEVHGLMTHAQMFQMILFVWLADRTWLSKARGNRVLAGGMAIILALACVMYVRFDNQCYMKETFQKQQGITFFTNLASRIRSAPGYRAETPVRFLNEWNIQDPTLHDIKELSFIKLPPYNTTITEYLNAYSWAAFMERWCGFRPEYYWDPENEPGDWPETKNMPHYPDDGSVKLIRGVLVVNF